MSDCPVLIVGAGPVGLTLAAFLTHYGISCRIIDKKSGPTLSSNAVGVHARTLELLRELNLTDRFIASGKKISTVRLYNHKELATQLDLEHLPTPYPFVCDIPQNETEAHLIQFLKDHNVNIDYDTSLIDYEMTEELATCQLTRADGTAETFISRWIIGADGYHSTVREKLKIPFEGKEYQLHFMMIDAVTKRTDGTPTEMCIALGDKINYMVFPMLQSARIIVEMSLSPQYNDVPLTAELFMDLAKKTLPYELEIEPPKWTSRFYVHDRLAKEYHQKRCFLMGDAAHVHIPVAGQGMNTGMQDAINFAWKLAQVEQGLAPTALLSSYHDERRPVAQKVLALTDIIGRSMLLQNPILKFLRRVALPRITKIAKLRHKLLLRISQIGVNYRKNHSICPSQLDQWQAGDRIVLAEGVTLGAKYWLLDFSGDLDKSLTDNFAAVNYVAKEKAKHMLDADSGYLLIRPDYYLAYAGKDKKQLMSFLKTLGK